jgi:hypothetical protein
MIPVPVQPEHVQFAWALDEVIKVAADDVGVPQAAGQVILNVTDPPVVPSGSSII